MLPHHIRVSATFHMKLTESNYFNHNSAVPYADNIYSPRYSSKKNMDATNC
jgi:hypothetical protein